MDFSIHFKPTDRLTDEQINDKTGTDFLLNFSNLLVNVIYFLSSCHTISWHLNTAPFFLAPAASLVPAVCIIFNYYHQHPTPPPRNETDRR